VLTLNAWNEWTEGSYLLAEKRTGTQYLEAIRAVFGRPKQRVLAVPSRTPTRSDRNVRGRLFRWKGRLVWLDRAAGAVVDAETEFQATFLPE
jgi:hypothetical protein